MANKFTNVSTYLVILFLVGLFAVGVNQVGSELTENDNANLDNASLLYITQLSEGYDAQEIADKYNITKEQAEQAILVNQNFSQGNPKDDALEFVFAKEKGFPLEKEIKRVFGLPSFILVDVLRLPANDWEFVLDTIGWFLFFALTISIINYVRKGTPDQ